MVMTKRILVVTTSVDRMGAAGEATGVWAEELAVPYCAFVDAGVELTSASTRGGRVPFDPRSTAGKHARHPAVRRLLDDAAPLLRDTRPIAEIDVDGFDAIFFPGGLGTMRDMPNNPDVPERIRRIRQQGGAAAVCHGPGAFVGVRLDDGAPFVRGRRLTSFTNEKERAVGLHERVPFLLESRLRQPGARFEAAPEFQPHTVREGRLITGQNPASSPAAAQAVLDALGLAKAA